MAQSQGLPVPRGFSARHLFERISSSVKPVPAMTRAVKLIKKAGEMMVATCSCLYVHYS